MIIRGLSVYVFLFAFICSIGLVAQPCSDLGYDVNLELIIEEELDVPQGSDFCINFSVNGYEDICLVSYNFTWDPSVITPNPASGASVTLMPDNFGLASFPSLAVNEAEGNGSIQFLTLDNTTGNGISLPDGSVIAVMCFTATGNPGDSTLIQITDNNTNFGEPEFAYCPTPQVNCVIDLQYNVGLVTIGCINLFAEANSCPADPGLSNGTITLTACGGSPNPNYSYSIDGGGNVAFNPMDEVVIPNIPTGGHTIIVTDNNGSTYSTNVTVGSGSSVDYNLTVTDPTCISRPDYGVITITGLTGGAIPYTYEWSNFEFGRDEIDRMEPGTYSVTVTDANGCSLSKSATIELDTLKAQAVIIQGESCNGANDAQVQLTADGGVPFAGNMYRFNNNPPSANPTILSGMPGGEYFYFQVKDDSGCESEIDSIFVPLINNPSIVFVQEDVTCNGAEDGMIDASLDNLINNIVAQVFDDSNNVVQGGVTTTAPGRYLNNTLAPGKYRIVITERVEQFPGGPIVSRCSVEECFTITEPDVLQISIDNIVTTQPSCAGGDGIIGVTAEGGTGPYTFNWNTTFVGNPITNLPFGDYQVTVTDDNGCQDDLMFTLTDSGNMLDIEINQVLPVTCPGETDAELNVVVNTGGNGFTYNWAQATGPSLSNTDNLSNIGPGEYFVTVTDPVLLCMAIDTFIVLAPSYFVIDTTVVQPTCPDESNGSISIIQNPTTPNGPYTFQWDDTNMSSTALISGLIADTYHVTVTDINLCDTVIQFVLTGPEPVIHTIIQTNTTTCNGEANGSLIVSAGGGDQGATSYRYTVLDANNSVVYSQMGPNPHTITGLAAGNYSISANDGACNSIIENFSIDEIEALTLNINNVTTPSCYGDCDGIATLEASGGMAPYTYTWLYDNQVSATHSNLCAGTYDIMVGDANNCEKTLSVEIVQPDTLIASINTALTQNISCSATSTGTIGISANGGNTTGYNYNWSPNVSNNNIANNLDEGIYIVTVSDALGCRDTVSYTLTTPPQVTAVVPTPLLPECFGETTCISVDDPSGGIGGPYVYSINNGLNIAIDSCLEVISGSYFIQVFDASGPQGCVWDTTIFVEQPNELIADFGTPPDPIQLGDSTVTVTVQITNDYPIDTIIWNPDTGIECVDPLCQTVTIFPNLTTSYEVTVYDINGCSTQDNVLIEVDDSRLVYLPNAFSPNNDGINDKFLGFTGKGVEAIISFQIYDRWGNKVYEEGGFDNFDPLTLKGWDGTFKGTDLPPGIFSYFMQVAFVDERIIDYSGSFTLMR